MAAQIWVPCEPEFPGCLQFQVAGAEHVEGIYMLGENLLRALRFAMVFPDSCAAIVQNSKLGLLFLVLALQEPALAFELC